MTPQDALVVAPNVKQAVETMAAFQKLKEDLLDANDTVMISTKRYIKRSGWRKISLAFNISTEIVEVVRQEMVAGDKVIGYVVRVKARATAPNGRKSEEIGDCETSELTKKNMEPTIHNIETKAATRAINRAISNLVGGGEVSAEEFADDDDEKPQTAPPTSTPQTQTARKPEKTVVYEWQVKVGPERTGTEYGIPVDSAPFKGFLRKTLDSALAKWPGSVIEQTKDGRLLALRVYIDRLTGEKVLEIDRAIMWTIQKCYEGENKIAVGKDDVVVNKTEE